MKTAATQIRLNAQAIYDGLGSNRKVGGEYWKLLFDANGAIIRSDLDELETEACHAHPLVGFYRDFAHRTGREETDLFVPYGTTVPVINDIGVLEAFVDLGEFRNMPVFRLAAARSQYRLDPRRLTIGILTAGGNAPGINTVIDSIVKRHSLLATLLGAKKRSDGAVEGLHFRGYVGGYTGLLDGKQMELTVAITDAVSVAAGSLLKMQRGQTPTDENERRALASRMAEAVRRDMLDILYVVGGNGTIRAADAVAGALGDAVGPQGHRVRVLAAPKTMDNDINFTDVTFGFRTTVNSAVELLRRIHLEAESCCRIGIAELFGAGSGFVALHAASGTGDADYVLIPEMMGTTEQERQAELQRAAKHLVERFGKKNHALLVAAEGASLSEQFKHGASASKKHAFEEMVVQLVDFMKQAGCPEPPVFTSRPQHLIRSIPPDPFDIDLCKQTGKLLVDSALAGFGRCVVSLWQGRFCLVPMSLAVAQLKQVNITGYYAASVMEKYHLPQASIDPSIP